MTNTRADIEHGKRIDIDIKIPDGPPISRQQTAIAVEDVAGNRFWVGFSADTPEFTIDWQAGHWYRLESVVGYSPGAEAPPDVVPARIGYQCPECGGELGIRRELIEPPPDARSAIDSLAEEGIEGVHLVALPDLDIHDLGEQLDDWVGPSSPKPSVYDGRGHYVCTDCDETIDGGHTGPASGDATPPPEPRVMNMGAGPSPVDDVAPVAETAAMGPPAEALGMATGGAKDVTNFRDNIDEGYLPRPSALKYEGLFYDYYFDTGARERRESLFYPSYSTAVTAHPVSDDEERYLSVGLNSNLTTEDFERKRLNLVAVLDISGSMSSPFDQYYYDEFGVRQEIDETSTKKKMEAARESLAALTTHLNEDDRFGVVLYNDQSYLAKPLRTVGETDMDAIRGHLDELTESGGTNMAAGFSEAVEMLTPHIDADQAAVENRIIFMTDAMPNLGVTGRGDLVEMIEDAADDHLYTTFIGIGLDSNPDLIESLSKVRGANHYFIHSTDEFEQRLDDEFEFMVTPLVFDLSLDVVAEGYEIDEVFGSPNADAATGEVMFVKTLFPTPTKDGETRGGVTLLRLERTAPDSTLTLVATWTERDGTEGRDEVEVEFPAATTEHFDNTGIRKATLLARYGEVLREWMAAAHSNANRATESESSETGGPIDDWEYREPDPMQPPEPELGQWEHQSVPLFVPQTYRDVFETFQTHFEREMEALDDDTLEQELEILTVLGDAPSDEESTSMDEDDTSVDEDGASR